MAELKRPELYGKGLLKSVERKQQKNKSGKFDEESGLFFKKDIKYDRWGYYLASHYFKSGIITPEMISQLRKGAKLLSVGTGPGHLEKTLLRFSIPAKNIDVSDIKLDEDLQNTPFKKHEFDMTRKWPEFKDKYDYIIFPESLGSANIETNGIQTNRFIKEEDYDLAKRILASPDILDHNTLYRFVEKYNNPKLRLTIKILLKALSTLKPNGQIRIINSRLVTFYFDDEWIIILAGLILNGQKIKYTKKTVDSKLPTIQIIEKIR